jgi:hypothetical protein
VEQCEEISCTLVNKEIYNQRKETIERIFGTAKENHGMNCTQYIGKARMDMKVGFRFTCLNLKKLAKMKRKYGGLNPLNPSHIWTNLKIQVILENLRKRRLALAC